LKGQLQIINVVLPIAKCLRDQVSPEGHASDSARERRFGRDRRYDPKINAWTQK